MQEIERKQYTFIVHIINPRERYFSNNINVVDCVKYVIQNTVEML